MASQKIIDVLLKKASHVSPPIWFMRQAGRYLPEYRQLRSQAKGFLNLCLTPEWASEITLQPIRRFDFDAAILFSDILMIPYGLGQSLQFMEGEGPVLKPIRSLDDFKALKTENFEQNLLPIYETVRRVKSALDPSKTFIGFAGSPWTVATYMVEGKSSRDFLHTKEWLYKNPSEFSQFLDSLVGWTVQYVQQQISAGVDVIQLFDSWSGVLSDDDFDRCVIEPTQKLVSQIKKEHPHIPIIGFPKGAGLMYKKYAEKTGVTAVGLDTTVPLEWARDNIQTQWPVQGNLDPILLLSGGNELDRRVDLILKTLGKGPFIFNLGHGILPPTPIEHVERVLKKIRDFHG